MVFVCKILTFLLNTGEAYSLLEATAMTWILWGQISKPWPMKDSIQSLPYETGKGTRLLEAMLSGLDLIPDGRLSIYFKKGFGLLDGACCMTAGWRMSPLGLRPCLLS